MAEKFGLDRHRPDGEWVQTTLALSVAGVRHRRGAVDAFCRAVEAAERKGHFYGVALRPAPDNRHDPNAIEVIGVVDVKPWLGPVRAKRWHVGFLDRETAAELQAELLGKGVPIAGELYSIYRSAGFVDIKVIVLAPPGFSHSRRIRTKG